MPTLIFTGPDNTGKTTTANHLVYELGGSIPIKKFKNESDEMVMKANVLDSLKLMRDLPEDKLMIFDRWHYPDDIIYAPIIEGKPSPLVPWIQEIKTKLMEYDVIFVVLMAAVDILKKRLIVEEKAIGSTYIKHKYIEEIVSSYQQFIDDNQDIPMIVINTSDKTVEQVCSLIRLFISK